jgi:peptidoglycan hydrolase-like protein with peptidoglycan-binding domain
MIKHRLGLCILIGTIFYLVPDLGFALPNNQIQTKKLIRGQRAPAPNRIKEIQQALKQAGFYSSEPTGRWDSQTIEAMKNFQASQGLYPNGKITALSLQKLGLGSPIAGIAPPV